jgi:hypothetical protein
MKSRTWRSALAAAALLGVGGGTAWAVFSWEATDDTTVRTARNLKPTVIAADGISGLYPGAVRPFTVQIANPNPYPIQVTYLEGHNPKMKSGCRDYSVKLLVDKSQLKSLIVQGNSTKKVPVRVTMRDWVKDECAGQTLPFRVRATARQAST